MSERVIRLERRVRSSRTAPSSAACRDEALHIECHRSPTFVGRARQIEVLRAALARALRGDGAVLTVAGEIGIGKTSLVREFARLAEQEGCLVLKGACYEGSLARAYEPFVTALDACVRETDPTQLRGDLGFGAAAIAAILPVVGQRLADLPGLEPLSPDEDRIRLYDAVARFLSAMAERTPLVVVLEDLHWADPDTLAMLRYVAHSVARLRTILIGTYREEEVDETHPLEALLAALHREADRQSLTLKGLDPEETSALARAVVEEWHRRAAPDSPEFAAFAPGEENAEWKKAVEEIHRESEGNPFFVRELVLHNLESGTWDVDEQTGRSWKRLGASGLPREVRRVIDHRLRRLSGAARRLLGAGAAFDGPFRFDVVVEGADLGEEEALGALDEVLDAHVLRPAAGENLYEFAHALVRRTAMGCLNSSRRALLHRRIAEILELRDPDRHAEIARHFHASALLPDAVRGVPHALAVAEQAERRAAFGEAVGALRIALDLLPADDPSRGSLLGRLGLALVWTLRFDAAMQVIEEAGTSLASREGGDVAADFLADAARALTIAGYQRGGWICAERGLRYISATRRDRSWFWLTHVDFARRRSEDPNDVRFSADTDEGRMLSRIAQQFAPTPLERLYLAPYFLPRIRREVLEEKLTDLWVLPCYDDQRFAVQVLEEGVKDCERKGRISVAITYLAWLARARTAAGDLAVARGVLDRARELSARLSYPSIQEMNLLAAESDLLFALDEDLGELVTRVGSDVLGCGAPEYNWILPTVRAGMARGLAHLGRSDEALAILPHLRQTLEVLPGWATSFVRITCDTAATLWLLGRSDHAELVERTLREKVLPSDLREYLRDVRLSLAQLCALGGRFDEAQEWFAQARIVLENQGARTLRALADYDEALMFARRAAPGDAARSKELARQALTRFTALGMTGWIRRATDLLEGEMGACESLDEERNRTAAERAEVEAILRLDGDYWTVAYEGTEARLRDVRGLHYLACLLRAPGRELHASDLVRLSAFAPAARKKIPLESADASVRPDLGDAGPSIDAQAAREYARRLEDLRCELGDAEECNDIGRAARAREEISFLVEALKSKRGRKVAAHAERARVAVSKGISTALRHIRRAVPDLADHLDATVRCGYFCTYKPDPRRPVDWQT